MLTALTKGRRTLTKRLRSLTFHISSLVHATLKNVIILLNLLFFRVLILILLLKGDLVVASKRDWTSLFEGFDLSLRCGLACVFYL